ncbi:MAG: immunoglobulin domain-containing protein [Verrucomicrobia bacterium]|nr:immunoglobulin domain-containing protein [Verrucomicrobiota bacterium]
MKRPTFFRGVGSQGDAWLTGAVLLLFVTAVQAQTIPNPSFEANTFTIAPGDISQNGAISGWTAAYDSAAGLNPAGGSSPYADNGAIPDGANVAFINYGGGALSTMISGLTVGQKYQVQFRANATAGQVPLLRVSIADEEMLALTVYPVGGSNPYGYLAFEFTAAATSQTLTLLNDTFDDATILVDDFKIRPSAGTWTVAEWNDDSDSGVDGQYVYTHAYNFGSAATAVINGVAFTGVAGANPAVADKFSSSYLGNLFAGDANDITGGGAVMARDFVYGGTVPAGSFQTLTLFGLTPGTEYVLTVYSAGWEAPGPTIRWGTASLGEDRLTINQDQFGNNKGIRFSCRYTADTSGTATFRLAPVNPANVSFHFYGFSNREAVSRNVAPTITQQPASITVSAGLPVQFSVAASGFPAPTYRWRRNGVDIPGATDSTYAIAEASAQTAGAYDVVVANALGEVTSAAAQLTVGIPLANPSFEVDSFEYWPGYSLNNVGGGVTDPGDNTPITGWNQSVLPGSGINPIANGASPFADNGVIPHGRQVAFLQADSTLDQWVSGLTVGSQYYLHYHANARGGGMPALEARLGGEVVVPAQRLTATGYREFYSDVFIATSTQTELVFEKSNPFGGDTTALIDNVAIVPVPAGTAPFLTKVPQAAIANPGETVVFEAQVIGSLPLNLQWTKNGTPIPGATAAKLTLSNVQAADEGNYALTAANAGGTVTTPAVRLTVGLPGIYGTGVAADGSLLGPGEVDPHYKLVASADENYPGPDAIVVNDGWPIAAGVWALNGPSSKWIAPQADQGSPGSGNAEGDYTYETSFDLTGYDVSRVQLVGGWAADNTGLDILVNGVSTGLSSGGFGTLTPFTITSGLVAGRNTLAFKINNLPATPNPTGLRVDLKGILVGSTTPPTMQVVQRAADVVISWSPAAAGQKLQSAPAVTGPWTDVTDATSPHTIKPSAAQAYFRVVQ